MNWKFFIAKRIYHNNEGGRQVSKPAVRIAMTGITLGLTVMIISVAVVLGFKHEVRNKVVSLGSDIIISNFEGQRTLERAPIIASDSVMSLINRTKGVSHIQRFSTKPGIIMTDDNFLGMALKGIGKEYNTDFFKKHLISGTIPKFSDESSSNEVILSKNIADKLNLSLKDKIYTYFVDRGDVRARRLRISGIYQTNFAAFDKMFLITDIHTVNRLNGWEPDQVTGIEVGVKNGVENDDVAALLRKKIDSKYDKLGGVYFTQTIQEQSPQIFAWLSLLDTNVWVILILMIGVAGFTMISGLLIIILERTNMIGILKALGANNRSIRKIFLSFAVFLIGKGMLYGNILGLSVCFLQNYFHLFKLDPTTYYVDYVPVEINWVFFILLNVGTFLVSILMLVGPSYLISSIKPAKSIRFE